MAATATSDVYSNRMSTSVLKNVGCDRAFKLAALTSHSSHKLRHDLRNQLETKSFVTMLRDLVVIAAAAAAVAYTEPRVPSPPCKSPLNPALETICFTTISTDGNYSIREYAQGLNVTLVSGSSSTYGDNWPLSSQGATAVSHRAKRGGLGAAIASPHPVTVMQVTLEYFVGANSAQTKIPLTVPLIYRPGATTLTGSLPLPTSLFLNPIYAPKPTYPGSKLEPFPAIRMAAVTFSTTQLATDVEYSFACGALTQWLVEQGVSPAPGPWQQAWATYSTQSESPHINECWVAVAAG